MFDPDLLERAADLLAVCKAKRLKLAAAESCTGGLVAAVLTEIPGSSEVFDRGFVTYSNEAKCDLLGVPRETIAAHGAVSEETAIAMAEGVLSHSAADIAVSITGIAGPGGGSDSKPVGLVHIACARRGGRFTNIRNVFPGNRTEIRLAALRAALAALADQATFLS